MSTERGFCENGDLPPAPPGCHWEVAVGHDEFDGQDLYPHWFFPVRTEGEEPS